MASLTAGWMSVRGWVRQNGRRGSINCALGERLLDCIDHRSMAAQQCSLAAAWPACESIQGGTRKREVCTEFASETTTRLDAHCLSGPYGRETMAPSSSVFLSRCRPLHFGGPDRTWTMTCRFLQLGRPSSSARGINRVERKTVRGIRKQKAPPLSPPVLCAARNNRQVERSVASSLLVLPAHGETSKVQEGREKRPSSDSARRRYGTVQE